MSCALASWWTDWRAERESSLQSGSSSGLLRETRNCIERSSPTQIALGSICSGPFRLRLLVPLPDQHIQTGKLALKRAALVACLLCLAGFLYPWLCKLLEPEGEVGWPYVVWCVSLAAGLPIVTVAERKLGPLRARHQALLFLVALVFAFCWSSQLAHLDGIAAGKTHKELLSRAFTSLRGLVSRPQSILYALATLSSLALPLLILANARKARVHLLIQVLVPAAAAVLIEIGVRATHLWSLGINHSFGAWSFVFVVPKAVGCAGYALVAAWPDRAKPSFQKT